jgi:glucose-6-phosphate 1-dehydrogenase
MRDAVREFARVQPPSDTVWERFASALTYVAGDPTDPELYHRVGETLVDLERRRGLAPNRLFYGATPPSLYHAIIRHLGDSGLAREQGGWSRIVIEKPFGHDAKSAR